MSSLCFIIVVIICFTGYTKSDPVITVNGSPDIGSKLVLTCKTNKSEPSLYWHYYYPQANLNYATTRFNTSEYKLKLTVEKFDDGTRWTCVDISSNKHLIADYEIITVPRMSGIEPELPMVYYNNYTKVSYTCKDSIYQMSLSDNKYKVLTDTNHLTKNDNGSMLFCFRMTICRRRQSFTRYVVNKTIIIYKEDTQPTAVLNTSVLSTIVQPTTIPLKSIPSTSILPTTVLSTTVQTTAVQPTIIQSKEYVPTENKFVLLTEVEEEEEGDSNQLMKTLVCLIVGLVVATTSAFVVYKIYLRYRQTGKNEDTMKEAIINIQSRHLPAVPKGGVPIYNYAYSTGEYTEIIYKNPNLPIASRKLYHNIQ